MPPITEARLFEAFGITPPEGEGAKEQEVAAPAAEETPAETERGEGEQEIAEPADEEAEPGTDGAPADEGQEEPEETGKPMSTEDRRANAARRRQQEQKAAIDKAVEDALKAEREKHDAAMKALFEQAGLVDSFTGKPITSQEELAAWHRKSADAKLQRDLKAGKLTTEGLNQLIGEHPSVKQAQEVVQQAQNARKEQEAAAAKARIDDELAQIAKLDPAITDIHSLLNMPTAAQFKSYVDKGYSFLDAFKLANMDTLSEAKAQRARESAQLNSRSKSHLVATGNARGAGNAPVPEAQMAMYRRMLPKATDAEIRKFHNEYLKRQGG